MRKAPINRGFLYPERDLNPHNRNGHRILSPACLPFHHPGNLVTKKYIQSSFSLQSNLFIEGDGGIPPFSLAVSHFKPPLQTGSSLKMSTGHFLYAQTSSGHLMSCSRASLAVLRSEMACANLKQIILNQNHLWND